MSGGLLQNALIYLGTAIVCVPISKKLGIGSVLGYLIGGVLVGPFILGLIGTEGQDVMHAAEFGVVMMLFIIGLELNPHHFWGMKNKILGLGGLQVGLTSSVLFFFFHFLLSLPINASLALGLTMAMSSTAIVLQTLKEKSIDKTHAGESSFSVLLFQDIAIIPIIALLPFLATQVQAQKTNSHLPEFLSFLGAYPSLILILAVGFVYVLSKYLAPFMFRMLAKLHIHELFTAAALFFVIGISWLMQMAGISAALGAFMAGVLLANSEFRHELEADINPFKSLLLGIFFTAVGSTINFDVLLKQPGKVALIVSGIMFVKWLVLFFIGKKYKFASDQNILFAFLLSQVGEFAFVLLSAMGGLHMLPQETLDLFMAVVALSMIVSPILLFVNEKFIDPIYGVKVEEPKKPYDEIGSKHKVILIGFGHFGSTLGRFLRANKINATIIDSDSDRVMVLRKMGFEVFYGDGSRLDLLVSAGAREAHILISAIDQPETNYHLAQLVPKHFPNLQFFVRAKNRFVAYELMRLGIKNIHRESMMDSVYMGAEVLVALGHRKYTVNRKAQDFIKYDGEAMTRLYQHWNSPADFGAMSTNENYIKAVRDEIEIQEQLLQGDRLFIDQSDEDSSWSQTVRQNE
jgi:monovalent cation:H+ antiporter-2, CPA2 family